MALTVKLAKRFGVAVGAHPGGARGKEGKKAGTPNALAGNVEGGVIPSELALSQVEGRKRRAKRVEESLLTLQWQEWPRHGDSSTPLGRSE